MRDKKTGIGEDPDAGMRSDQDRSGFACFAFQGFISGLGDEFGQMGAVIIDSLDGIVFLDGAAFGFLGIDHLRAFGFVDFDFGFFLHVVEFLHFLLLGLMVECPENRALSVILTSNCENTIPEIKNFSEKSC